MAHILLMPSMMVAVVALHAKLSGHISKKATDFVPVVDAWHM